MNRYDIIQDYVYKKYANIYNPNIRVAALTHTASVVNNATLLAVFHKEDIELIQIAALLHDFALYYENALPKMHGEKGGEIASTYLQSLNLFSSEEIQKITFAISVHSKKDEVHSSFDEILKDADLMAKYLVNPKEELKDYEKKRLADAFYKIQMTANS